MRWRSFLGDSLFLRKETLKRNCLLRKSGAKNYQDLSVCILKDQWLEILFADRWWASMLMKASLKAVCVWLLNNSPWCLTQLSMRKTSCHLHQSQVWYYAVSAHKHAYGALKTQPVHAMECGVARDVVNNVLRMSWRHPENVSVVTHSHLIFFSPGDALCKWEKIPPPFFFGTKIRIEIVCFYTCTRCYNKTLLYEMDCNPSVPLPSFLRKHLMKTNSCFPQRSHLTHAHAFSSQWAGSIILAPSLCRRLGWHVCLLAA